MKVKVKMYVEVETTIDSSELDSFSNRLVDVYLHGQGKVGHLTKEDLGGQMVKFEVLA